MNNSKLLEFAKYYVSKGFSVIPLQSRSKIPALESWKEYQKRYPTEEELELWFGGDSVNNIAIVTGEISGIAVIDFDKDEALALFDEEEFKTPTVISSRGPHHYYLMPAGLRNFQSRNDLPGIDLRAEGGLIVAPPSIHRSGHQYVWKEGFSLDDLPLREFPQHILSRHPLEKSPLKELYKGVSEGKRNVSLTRLVGSWVNDGLSYDECLRLASLVNSGNIPPLAETEVERTVSSIYEKHHREKEEVAEYSEPIDTSQFNVISSKEIIDILGLTIKKDEENKLITFLGLLSAFTRDSQLNISFNAPSSTGKSYIPTEIARLFPKEDVIQVAYCSPTAFFHDVGVFDKKIKGYIVDLERKILIFLDQPHQQLLQHLRPLLSHDEKEIHIKITDKTQKAGLRTKNIVLKGFPAVIFCTAGLKIDEQEATRFLLLSPDTEQDKLRAAIAERIKRETDREAYFRLLDEQPDRKLLKERIRAIKQEGIEDIKIECPETVSEMFLQKRTILKPRHQRDIAHVLSLIKIFSLLNVWFREKDDSTITANENDVIEAFELWDVIAESQDLSIPPYIYQIYQEIILPTYKETGQALTRKEVTQKHYEIYGRYLSNWALRDQIIPMLENVGLITQERDPNCKTRMLIYPTSLGNDTEEPQTDGHEPEEHQPEIIDLEGALKKACLGKYK